MNFKHIFYDWGGLNAAWFEAINHATPNWLAPFAQLGSALGNYWGGPFLLTALVFWWWRLKTANQSTAAFAVRFQTQRFALGLVATWVAVALTKLLVDFPRPLVALPDMVRVIGEPELQYSFPSGHAAYTVLAVVSLWPLVPSRFRIGLLAWLLWVGWSRIAVGAHFPADVFAGFLIGGLLAWITHVASRRLRV